jgi:hypothetical protein
MDVREEGIQTKDCKLLLVGINKRRIIKNTEAYTCFDLTRIKGT